MRWLLVLLLVQGSLEVTFGAACIEQTLKCTHRRIPFSTRKNLPETVEAVDKACRDQGSYYNCLIDVEKTMPKPEGAVPIDKVNRIESEYTLHELCTDGFKLRASYFKHVSCMNQQQTDICTSPNFISILMSNEKSPSECSIQHKVTSCIAMMIAVNCGSEAEFIYRKLVHIANDGDVHCHSGEDIGDIISKMNLREKNKNVEDQMLHRIGELVSDLSKTDADSKMYAFSTTETSVAYDSEDSSGDELEATSLENKDLEILYERWNTKSATDKNPIPALNETSSFTFNESLRVTALNDGTIDIQWLKTDLKPNISLNCSHTRNESAVRFECIINRMKAETIHNSKEMEQTQSSDTAKEPSNKLLLKDAEIYIQNRIKRIRNDINEIKESIGNIENYLEYQLFKDVELEMNIPAARELYDESKILKDVLGSSEMEVEIAEDKSTMDQSSQVEKESEHLNDFKIDYDSTTELYEISEQNLEDVEYLTIERQSYDEMPHNFIKLKPSVSLEQTARDMFKAATNIAHNTEYMLSDEYMVISEKSKVGEDSKGATLSTIIGAALDEVAENTKLFEYAQSLDPAVINIIDTRSEYTHDSVEDNSDEGTGLELENLEENKQIIDKFENDQCAVYTFDESDHVSNADSNDIYKVVDTTNQSSENYCTFFAAKNENEYSDKLLDESNIQNGEVAINISKTPLEDNSGYSAESISELNEVMDNGGSFVTESIDEMVYTPLTEDATVTEASVMTDKAADLHIGKSVLNQHAFSTTETSVAFDIECSNPSLNMKDSCGTTTETSVKDDTAREEWLSESHAPESKKYFSESDENFPERMIKVDSEDPNEMGLVGDLTENLHPTSTNEYKFSSEVDGAELFEIVPCSTNSDSVCNSVECSSEKEGVICEDSRRLSGLYSREEPTFTSIEHIPKETESNYKDGIYEKIMEFARNI